MCKLAGWTACKDSPLSRQAADAALQAAAKIISATERNGFGFAQSGASGLHGRFVNPSDFRSLTALPEVSRLAGPAFGAFAAAKTSSQTGTYHKAKHTIVHGRTATCAVNLANTHPFRHNGWTLAHNGVVTWQGQKTVEHANATCDSQHLLYALVDHAGNLEQQRLALHDISGYAAFLAMSPRGKLIVARDAMADLYAGITKKGRWIFGTKASIVEAIADAWNCSSVEAFALDNWTWLEFSPQGGRPKVYDWRHREATYRETKFSSASLGRTVTGYSSWKTSQSVGDSATAEPKRSPAWDADGMYYTKTVPSTDGVLTQHNLDEEDGRPINERYVDESDLELELQLEEDLKAARVDVETAMPDYIPARQRKLEGIL